ncbi:Piso0_002412 [Millerozyma farinosa CBS 7064]|uniref:Piso0_002412 protein n=1 Tax=Pichia sorbitophila (strain ATCC MYA-4447 / BCRC 22081 / CBS 7064 / NBRC 10061 / NRRL Y-12695) TaxID=559304 RepID=G8YEZ7_PICSO|nr:Piso0_002412 [Millerozyma farinosa CBS 7064]
MTVAVRGRGILEDKHLKQSGFPESQRLTYEKYEEPPNLNRGCHIPSPLVFMSPCSSESTSTFVTPLSDIRSESVSCSFKSPLDLPTAPESCNDKVSGAGDIVSSSLSSLAADEEPIQPLKSSSCRSAGESSFSPSMHTASELPGCDSFEAKYRRMALPVVTLTTNSLEKKDCDSYELECLVSMKPPPIVNIASSTSKEQEMRSNVLAQCTTILLTSVSNWEDCSCTLTTLGSLWLFDQLAISTNGKDWDTVCVFLFSNVMLLVGEDLTEVIGQIRVQEEICSINHYEQKLYLNLVNEALPELQISHKSFVMLSKWNHYLNCAIQGAPSCPTSLFQITYNLWSLVPPELRPQESVQIYNAIEKDMCFTDDTINKISIPPHQLPLNIIVVISLINTSNQDNETYRECLVSYLENVRNKLRSVDKLGLIFVGVDGCGTVSKGGSFIGCAAASWNGWDTIFNELSVFSNVDYKMKPIFNSAYEEYLICFNKCEQLITFMPENSVCINRLIIINSNIYSDNLVSESIRFIIKAKLNSLLKHNNLTIELYRIGEEYPSETETVFSYLSSPIYNGDEISLKLGSKLFRLDNFKQLMESFEFNIDHCYRSTNIPFVSLNISRSNETSDIICFKEVEVNGKMIDLPQSSNVLRIVNKNNFAFTEKNILLKFKLRGIPNAPPNQYVDYPIVKYSCEWPDGKHHSRSLTRRFSNYASESPSSLISNANTDILYSPLDDLGNDSYKIDVPIVADSTSSRPTAFARHKTELAISSCLMNNLELSGEQARRKLDTLIKSIRESYSETPPEEEGARGENIDHDLLQYQKIHTIEAPILLLEHQNYIMRLLDAMREVAELLDHNPSLAVVKWKDFINWIG